MKVSKFALSTLKDAPADANTISHKLMIRAGLIRQVASGIYTWLPIGLKVLRKVENIVRDEMNKIDALEILMPAVQPAELWQETGRWDFYGDELLRIKDRHNRDFCIGPTHEEIITDLVRNEIKSYKQFPVTYYQIQTKFRDEIRPRFGVMRGREFLMKDAYSFHLSEQSLDETYNAMYQAYSNIFSRIGLKFKAVIADNGSIGGTGSHEFHVLASSGEDDIVFAERGNYVANLEKATSLIPEQKIEPLQNLELIDTPAVKTINELSKSFNISKDKMVKTLIVKASDDSLIALVLRGDDDLNEVKALQIPNIKSPLTFATAEEIFEKHALEIGSIGVVNLAIPYFVDHNASILNNFVCGANINGKHYFNVNWHKDAKLDNVHDLRVVKAGDNSPDGNGVLKIEKGIEVGHIFKLGTKYSTAMNLRLLNENSQYTDVIMGCYGIGVSRIVAAFIEQNFDQHGIIWNNIINPFDIIIIPIGYENIEIKQKTDEIYHNLINAGFDVLLDDRDKKISNGNKFADADLIGIPHRLVIGQKTIKDGKVEYKSRTSEVSLIDADIIVEKIQEFYK